MAALSICAIALTAGLCSAGIIAQQPITHSLYAQATAAMLDRDFPARRIEYLLIDVPSQQAVAARWANPGQPIPVGSLLKPFVALAYAQQQSKAVSRMPFPTVHCHGRSDGCWHPSGHGSLTLERALAVSCNAYFLALARQLDAPGTESDSLQRITASYGLPPPPLSAGPSALIGLSPEWRIAPLDLARAYARLIAQAQSGDTVLVRLVAGMRQAALPGGTASRIAALPGGVLAKTGTAPCVPDTERCIANGDGLAVVLVPAESPRLLLLVRERGTTGAQAAEVGGRMLAHILQATHP